MFFTLLTVFVALILAYKYLGRGNKNRPPSAPALPFIGSLPFLSIDMRKNLSELHKKYGPIFTFQMGPDNWMAVCDFNLYKETMHMDEFQDRPSMGALADMLYPDENGQVRGVMFSNGTEWQEQRRFLLRELRDFGFGKMKMEPLIHEELKKSIEMIKLESDKSKNNRLSLNLRLNVSVLNSLWHLITGENFQHNDPKLKIIFDKINLFMTSTTIGGPITAFPWLKYVAPEVSGYNRVMSVFNDVLEIVKESHDQHQETFNKEEMRDFMDVFIREIDNATNDSSSSFHGEKGMKNLLVNMINLFIGGADTTSSTLCWSLFYLSKNPLVQERAIEEIERVVGFDRLPSLEDKPNTPYLEAIVCETHRIVSLAFAGIPRLVSKDTTLGGYFIEKGTRVMIGIWEIMHDESYWDSPDIFRPERFLNDTRTKITNIERLIPFGIGKRMCVGSSFAQAEIYLFLAGLIQNFKFEDPTPDQLEPSSGFVLGCPNFSLKVTPRF